MSNVWATMPYVQLSHKVFVICIKNRQNNFFSEMSLRDVMELPCTGNTSYGKANICFLIMADRANHMFSKVYRTNCVVGKE